MRTLALPMAAAPWTLTSLREKLIKIGAKGRQPATVSTSRSGSPRSRCLDRCLRTSGRLSPGFDRRPPPSLMSDRIERDSRRRQRCALITVKRRVAASPGGRSNGLATNRGGRDRISLQRNFQGRKISPTGGESGERRFKCRARNGLPPTARSVRRKGRQGRADACNRFYGHRERHGYSNRSSPSEFAATATSSHPIKMDASIANAHSQLSRDCK